MTLTLAEELLLIATHDEKGSLLMAASTAIPYGLAGALLFELVLGGRLHSVEGRLAVADRAPTGDALADEALELISANTKEKDAKFWVSRLARKIKRIDRRVFGSLVENGILVHVEKHFLWVVPYQRYPERDPQPERLVREKLRDLLRGVIAPNDRLLALLGLVLACDLLGEIVPKGERRAAKSRAKEMLGGEGIGKAVADVVRDIHTAVIAGVIAATAASTAASS
ncbi:MAG: GPP34 family phosphoprotein [Bacteroidota bacterium]|jgi:AcrR family transcriptional regulator|nr:GPP34 family phosphoprotein [Bacteroidota bacterium]